MLSSEHGQPHALLRQLKNETMSSHSGNDMKHLVLSISDIITDTEQALSGIEENDIDDASEDEQADENTYEKKINLIKVEKQNRT